MILTGNTLGKRQQDLNIKVNTAAEKHLPLEEFNADDDCDISKLFKLNLASKYKDVNYLIETLKSGDGLHVTMAMKCLWLYDTDHQDVINSNYIHNNIFPCMSKKIRKKFLQTICKNVKEESRALDFYKYCVKERLSRFAFKFLISTSLDFKTEMIGKHFMTLQSILENEEDVLYLIGNDFDLAELYIDQKKLICGRYAIYNWDLFSYLYYIDSERYLEKWEKYFEKCRDGTFSGYSEPYRQVGSKISKNIMLKHKSRILNYVQLYYKIVNLSIFSKYTTKDEAKLYAVALLPDSAKDFWSSRFKETYKVLLDIIPSEERFKFIKNIFETKYVDNEFEMTSEFYHQKYFEIMSVDERESWALRHLSNPNKSFLSDDEDSEYIWYKYVNLDKALPEIRKYIQTTPDANKRAIIVKILIESTRSQDELQRIFQYYYEKHVNEDKHIKEIFLFEVIDRFSVWDFSEACWESFNKLLYSIELYNPKDSQFNSYRSVRFLFPALFYHVLNNKDFNEGLNLFVESDNILNFYLLRNNLDNLHKKEHKDQIFQYFRQLCVDKFKDWLEKNPDVEITKTDRKYINLVMELIAYYKKNDEELPEIMTKYVKSASVSELLTQNQMIQLLKHDAHSILSKLPLLQKSAGTNDIKIDLLLKKLKVYFANDLAQEFLKYFCKSLSELDSYDYRSILTAVHGIFTLGDESFKKEFMAKYVPAKPKIDHLKIDRKHLYIQEAICRFACYSRPPVPLDNIRKYITGDYVHYCLPMFYMYAANLPPQECLEFVKVLIDAPVSVQKHGLRLAFRCFSFDHLKTLILKIWKQSKNISLRMVIYTSLFEEILKQEDNEQSELFKIFLTLSSELHKDDHDVILNILTSGHHQKKLPEKFINEFFQTAWMTVNNFPDNNKNINRKVSVIQKITSNIHLFEFSAAHQIVDDYLNAIFTKKHILPDQGRDKFERLYEAKLKLTTTFIAYYDDELHIKTGLKLVQFVLAKCSEMWKSSETEANQIDSVFCKTDCTSTKYLSRLYCDNFIFNLESKHFNLCLLRKKDKIRINVLFDYIAKNLQDSLPFHEIYLLMWRIRILIITNIVLDSRNESEGNLRDIATTIIKRFAIEVTKIMKMFINQQRFHLTLLDKIAEIVVKFVGRLYCFLKVDLDDHFDIADVITLVAKELVNQNSEESLLMCISILPILPSPNTTNEYQYVIKSIKHFECHEVQALFYQKIVRSNQNN